MLLMALAGKLLYTVIEIVDVTIYAAAYRGAAMVIFNKLSSAISRKSSSKFDQIPIAVFPAILAQLDRFEDLLQVNTISLSLQCHSRFMLPSM